MTTSNRSGRYAPSRFYFPLSKLIAYALLRWRPNDNTGGRYSYTFHSEHSRLEAPLISIYMAFFTYLFWFGFLSSLGASWPVAAISAAIVGTVFWTAWVCTVGVIAALIGGWTAMRVTLHTAAMIGVSTLMALFMMKRGGIYAAAATPWLIFLCLNLLAWPIALSLKRAMASREKELT